LKGLIQARNADLTQQLKTWNREFTADIKEIVLDFNEYLADLGGQVLGEKHPDRAVELINITDRVDACVVFRNTASITQAGGAIVASASGNCGETIGHMGVTDLRLL
jgi:hypothetical protein